MSAPSSQRILTEQRGHILLITINRPEAKNAFDATSAQAMHAAMDLLDATDALFVGVVTGAGGTFSAGADLVEGGARRRPSARSPSLRAGRRVVEPRRPCPRLGETWTPRGPPWPARPRRAASPGSGPPGSAGTRASASSS